MNERITKLRADYEKNAEKISSLQAKNKRLADKITQLENAEIIGAVRTSGLTIDELLSLFGKSETKHDLEENDNEL